MMKIVMRWFDIEAGEWIVFNLDDEMKFIDETLSPLWKELGYNVSVSYEDTPDDLTEGQI